MVRMLRFVLPFVVVGTMFGQPTIDGVFEVGEGWGTSVGSATYSGIGITSIDVYLLEHGDSVYLCANLSGVTLPSDDISNMDWIFNINSKTGGDGGYQPTEPSVLYDYSDNPDFFLEGDFGGTYQVGYQWSAGWEDQGSSVAQQQFGVSTTCVEIRMAKALLGNPGYTEIQFYLYSYNSAALYCACPNNPLSGYATGVTLPVELTSFLADVFGQQSSLKWSTATEIDCAAFDVERKSLGVSPKWNRIGSVSGQGTSNAPHEYSYTDAGLASGRYAYRLKQIDNDGSFSYSQEAEVEITDVPTELALGQNYPNPFNPETVIGYWLVVGGEVNLRVYDLLGREVAVLVDGVKSPGTYTVPFNGTSLASGTYVYQLQANGKTMTRVMTLLR